MIKFLKDESGQGAAEFMLVTGGIIVIVIAAILAYQGYTDSLGGNITEESQNLTENISSLSNKFK